MFERFWHSFFRAFSLEVRGIRRSPVEFFASFLWPIFLCVVFASIFGTGQLTRLPVGIVDLDQSSLSRQVVERVVALPSVDPRFMHSALEADRALTERKTYATLVIPADWSNETTALKNTALEIYLNKAFYLAATNLEVDLKMALADFAFSIKALKGNLTGHSVEATQSQLGTIVPDVYFEGNQSFNFTAYLFATFIPGLLTLGAALCFIGVMFREWRDGGVRHWLRLTNGSIVGALLGKLSPWMLLYFFGFVLWIITFTGLLGWNVESQILWWILGSFVYVLSLGAITMLFITVGLTWVLALASVIAFFAPTFPFTGFSFPLDSMSPGAEFFGNLLPLTHYIYFQSSVWNLASPTDHILSNIGTMALYIPLGLIFALTFFKARMRLWAKKEKKLLALYQKQLETHDNPDRSMKVEHFSFLSTIKLTLKDAIVNRDTFVICVVAVAFYLLFYAWPYSNQQIEHVEVGVVDLDRTATSRVVLRNLDALPAADIQFIETDLARAKDLYRHQRVDVLIVLPKDLEKEIREEKNTAIHVLANGAYPVKGRAIQGALAGLISDKSFLKEVTSVLDLQGHVLSPWAERLTHPSVIVSYRFNEISGYGNYIVPSVGPIIIQAVLLMAVTMGVGGWLIMPRRPAWFQALLNRPYPNVFALILGFTLLGMFWAIYMEGFAFFTNEFASFKTVIPTIIVSFLFPLAVVLEALFIVFAMGSNRFTSQIVVLLSTPAAFISGGLWPSQSLGSPLVEAISLMFPSTPAIQSFILVSQSGAGFTAIIPQILLLIVQIFVFGAMTLWVLRERHRPYPLRPLSLQD